MQRTFALGSSQGFGRPFDMGHGAAGGWNRQLCAHRQIINSVDKQTKTHLFIHI